MVHHAACIAKVRFFIASLKNKQKLNFEFGRKFFILFLIKPSVCGWERARVGGSICDTVRFLYILDEVVYLSRQIIDHVSSIAGSPNGHFWIALIQEKPKNHYSCLQGQCSLPLIGKQIQISRFFLYLFSNKWNWIEFSKFTLLVWNARARARMYFLYSSVNFNLNAKIYENLFANTIAKLKANISHGKYVKCMSEKWRAQIHWWKKNE